MSKQIYRSAVHPMKATFTGWDGNPYSVGDRVEIHPGTDLWMQGARFGEVVGSSITANDRVHVRLDKTGERVWSGPEKNFRKLEQAQENTP